MATDELAEPVGDAVRRRQNRPPVQEAFEVVRQGCRRGVAALGVDMHRLGGDPVEVAAQRRPQLRVA